MDTAYISTISALAGSVVGGLTSGATTWLSPRAQARTGQRLHRIAQREALYRDFIIAASEMYGSAVVSTEPKINEAIVLYGMISRMRVLSTPEVVEAAEIALDAILAEFVNPVKTVTQVRELIKTGNAADPLRSFSKIAREELQAL